MSYRLAFQAFIKRFQKRFPSPEYTWAKKELGYDPIAQEWREETTFTITKGTENICTINGDVSFGIRLYVSSPFLKQDVFLHRRPKRLVFANQHNMRQWLKNKPKLRQLGASVASSIVKNQKANQKKFRVVAV